MRTCMKNWFMHHKRYELRELPAYCPATTRFGAPRYGGARSLPPAALPTDFSLGSVLLYGWHRVLLDTTQAAKNFKPQNLRLVPITAAKNVCAVCVAPANSKCAGCGLVVLHQGEPVGGLEVAQEDVPEQKEEGRGEGLVLDGDLVMVMRGGRRRSAVRHMSCLHICTALCRSWREQIHDLLRASP
eukprot:COSAG02_NODE_19371_length_885_cov_1.183206_2_plen_186_part_00